MNRSAHPAWIAARERLHSDLEGLHPLRDASQLAYLRGPVEALTEADVVDLWRDAATRQAPGELSPINHVYVHVPFCKSICSFCNYERLRPSSPKMLHAWLERVQASVEALSPAVRELQFHSLYIGGGTPSTLPPPLLEKLLTSLDTHLNFVPNSSRHIEFDPAVFSQARIAVLQRHGFSRYSFGIQSLDPAVNDAHNRGMQDRRIVGRFFDAVDDAERVACDFLLGLEGTTPESILSDLAWVLEHHKPAAIDIFALVPTQAYVRRHFGGDLDAFWAHLNPFQEVVPAALPALCEAHGYRWHGEGGHRYTLVRTAAHRHVGSPYSYAQLVSEQSRPLNLLGLGTSARSQLFRCAAFQYRDPEDDVGADGPAWYEGHRIDPEVEQRTYLIHQLRDRGMVDAALFERIFGVSLEAAAGPALAAWSALGVGEMTDGILTLQKQSNLERARTLLWLVPEVYLEHEMARIMGFDLSARATQTAFQDIPVGRALVGPWRYWGVRSGAVLLKGPDHKVRLRVAPPRERGGKLRLVVETMDPGTPTEHLGRAVGALKRFANQSIDVFRAQTH